jgi:hypothetical protein
VARDITALVKGKPVQDAVKSHSERMNQLITESDRELLNTWHPQRRRLAWPKGISK